MEAKELLAIVDRVGKLAAEEGAGGAAGEGAGTGSMGAGEESLLERMSDETRKRIYELLVGNVEEVAGDEAG